jgi:hypothetical protein
MYAAARASARAADGTAARACAHVSTQTYIQLPRVAGPLFTGLTRVLIANMRPMLTIPPPPAQLEQQVLQQHVQLQQQKLQQQQQQQSARGGVANGGGAGRGSGPGSPTAAQAVSK